MSSTSLSIHGVIPALILCNDTEGNISEENLERQLRYLLDGGIHGIFLNGTTGEGAVLTTEEKVRILRHARGLIADRIPIYAVCQRPSTTAVVEEIKAMAQEGASCVAAVTPYYYTGGQDLLMAHFTRIADESPLPLMLYNIPQNTHFPIAPETVVALSRHPNIVGIKDSSGNFAAFHRMFISTDASGFTCVQGNDPLDAASFAVGVRGIVTGLGNVRVEPYVEMYRAAVDGDRAKLAVFQKRIYEMARIAEVVGGKTIPAIKAAVELLGRARRAMKIEGLTLSESEVGAVKKVLEEAGVL